MTARPELRIQADDVKVTHGAALSTTIDPKQVGDYSFECCSFMVLLFSAVLSHFSRSTSFPCAMAVCERLPRRYLDEG